MLSLGYCWVYLCVLMTVIAEDVFVSGKIVESGEGGGGGGEERGEEKRSRKVFYFAHSFRPLHFGLHFGHFSS